MTCPYRHQVKTDGNAGVTLIEVLIAVLVMTIGLAGLFILFHPSLRASQESLEETRAVLLAQSIRDSLTNALRLAQYDEATDTYTVTFTHDMEGGKLVFKLPQYKVNNQERNNHNEWVHYPPDPDPNRSSPTKEGGYFVSEKDRALFLNKDWVANVVKEISKQDQSEPYDQFMFSFDVRREETPRLYGFRINVFRSRGSETDKEHIKTFPCHITVP
jgi:type IV pilus modification protein PilV